MSQKEKEEKTEYVKHKFNKVASTLFLGFMHSCKCQPEIISANGNDCTHYIVTDALKVEKRTAVHIRENSLFICGLVSLKLFCVLDVNIQLHVHVKLYTKYRVQTKYKCTISLTIILLHIVNAKNACFRMLVRTKLNWKLNLKSRSDPLSL